jgi:hypothetical protein
MGDSKKAATATNVGDGSVVVAFLAFHAPYVTLLAVWTILLAAVFYWPKWVGLFLFLPYMLLTYSVGGKEMKDGAPWKSFSQNFFLFRIMRSYLKFKCKTPLPKELVELDNTPNAQAIFALFPHGVNAEHRILMEGILHHVLPNLHSKIRTLAASILFRLFLMREIVLWSGCIDARRSVAEKALERGLSLMVQPGGMEEQLLTQRGKEILYINNRKGFVKLAMSKGIPVVPVYTFGVNDFYNTSNFLAGPRKWLMKTLGVCLPLAMGQFGSYFCPLPVETTIVFGKPLYFELKEKGSPTKEELDGAHKQFCDAIRQLFEEHKGGLGYGDRELQFV